MRRILPLAWLVLLVVPLLGCGGGGDSGCADGDCDGSTPECTGDADCAPGESCDASGSCVADTGCIGDEDCGGGQICEGGSCVDPACGGDEDCGEGLICLEGACVVDDCAVAGCPGEQKCRAEDNACVECLENTDCGGDSPWCEKDSGACVACRGDGDCEGNPAGELCGASFTCVECLSDAECGGDSPKCRTDVGICGTCATDTDCPGSHCREDATCYLGPEEGEACTPQGACAPGLACVGDTCTRTCNVYAPTCPTGTGCMLLGNSEGRALIDEDGDPVGACVDNSSGAGVNRDCTTNSDCRAGLFCVPDSPDGGVCKPLCEPGGDAANCGSSDVCVSIALGENGEDVGLCTASTTWLSSCTSNGDCDDGQGCMPLLENGELVGRCEWNAGTGGALQPCDTDEECRSGLCLAMQSGSDAGFCFDGCTDDASCGGDGICTDYNFNVGDGGTATTSGCRPACEADNDCSSYGDDAICALAVFDGELTGVCGGRVGPADGGESCTDDDACGTGLCFSNEATGHPADAGFCLGACEVDADCGPNTVCRGVAFNVGTAANPVMDTTDICWGQACAVHSDCPAGWTCDLESDPAGGLRTSCSPAYGDGLAGDACTDAMDCATRVCFPVGVTGESICWGPCLVDEDCGTGFWCGMVTFPTDDGPAPMPACLPL